jgi:LPXTG-motif cell wall-anchored protein
MLKFRLATVAILVAVFGLFSVSSASAQYAPCSIEFDVDPDSLDDEGDVEGDAESDIPGEWTASNDLDGQTANGSGDTFNFTFSFPEVDDETEVTITVILVREDQITCEASETITLNEEDDDGDGDGDGGGGDENGGLPDTGGTDRTAILTGIALMAAGGGAVYLARRRNEDTA